MKHARRIAFDAALFCSMLFLPIWFTGVLLVIGVIYFHFWWESIFFALILEGLFSGPVARTIDPLGIAPTLAAVFGLIVVYAVRVQLRRKAEFS